MQDLDIQRLRAAVLEPQGLGSPEERKAIWYALLGVQAPPAQNAYKSGGSPSLAGTQGAGATPASPVPASDDNQPPVQARSGLPTIQFGTFTGSDASSYDSDSNGGQDSTLGSGSVTTESQHALPATLEQLKPPAPVASAGGDEWQTVSKRKRAGSRANSQLGHIEDPSTSSSPPSAPTDRDESLTKSVLPDTSRSGASSPAPPKLTVGPTRSVNRFDALSDSASKSSASSPEPTRKRSQILNRKRAGSRADSISASTSALEQPDDRSHSSPVEVHASSEVERAEPAAEERALPETRSSVDRIAEMLRGSEGLSPKDAHQVELDVNRSFLNFRKGSLKNPAILAARRRQLSTLCTGVLQRRKALSYYQGYHDVLTVLLLTLLPDTNEPDSVAAIPSIPPELHLAAERLSLHWLRDAMTQNLDAAMGHLRLLRVLLQKVDPELAGTIERAFPLPYFALPWLITLLTHSLPDLAQAQRVLDFVLIYGPMSTLYLCVTIIQMNKERAQAAEVGTSDEDDFEAEIRIHQALAALPSFRLDDEAVDPNGEDEEEDPRGDDQFADAVNDDSLYDDPDVFGPADSSRTTASKSSSSNGGAKRQARSSKGSSDAIPISRLLRQTADLMERHGLRPVSGERPEQSFDSIMGPGSVLRTWSDTVEQQRLAELRSANLSSDSESPIPRRSDAKWDQVDERAEYIIRVDSNDIQPDGPEPADNLLIVHPELPAEPEPLDVIDESSGPLPDEVYAEKSRRPRMRTPTSVRASHKGEQASLAAQTTTVTIAALGVAGVLLGMYAASNSGSSVGGFVAAGAGDRAEQARDALALLARWLSLMH
ncbi:hypothetical protein A4X09_0g3106 [Tilletia walkeri]|uniref:Rab-GAP TBC domain-containing protein n=1 Tax=Tilletia walkeri TaxID=117179 RepID=A0A8X7N9P2_9BASI|nr:hypothetical protein A4X09_0g3106 [Tilletia walkeri]